MRRIDPKDLRLGPAGTDHHFTGPPECHQAPNQGSVSVTEGRLLRKIAQTLGGVVLEIGSDLGISTRYIWEGLQGDEHAAIMAVDPCHKWKRDVWPGIMQIDVRTADLRYRAGWSTLKYVPWAWAFVDGDHRYEGVAADILLCRALCIPFLVFHDCSPASVRRPENTSAGSDAREAVLDAFPEKQLVEVATECGIIIWSRNAELIRRAVG